MDTKKFMQAISEVGSQIKNTYLAEDGLLHCNDCNEPRQCYVDYQGKRLKMPCTCSCNEMPDYYAEQQKQQEQERINRAFRDSKSREQTFDADDGKFGQKQMATCKNWISKLPDALENPDFPHGLLLFGDPDGGKTFAASCIANAALDKGMAVVMRSVPWLLAQDIDARPAIIEQMQRADLLVLDDLGAERGTDYAKEIVYTVIDERYKAGKLIVVTTNLVNSELANAADIRDKRTFNRLLEVCYPLRFDTGRKRYTRTSIAAMEAAINS